MQLDPIDAFLSVINQTDQQQNQQGQSLLLQNGNQTLANLSTFQVGFGNIALYADRRGIWLGNSNFNNAPFSVDMNGNLVANSGKILTYRKSFISTMSFSQNNTGLTVGSPNTTIAYSAFNVLFNGNSYSFGGSTSISLGSGTIPSGTWGVFTVTITTGGSVTVTPGTANYTTGYASQSAATAAHPSVPAGQMLVGIVLISAGGTNFVVGTTAMVGGTNAFFTAAHIPSWTSGQINFSGGSTYSISSGVGFPNDFNMVQYIYFDTSVSTTSLLSTTSTTTAIGITKSLLNIYTADSNDANSYYINQGIQG